MGLFLFYQISGVFSFWGHKIRGWVFFLFNIPLIQPYKWGTHGWRQVFLLFSVPWMKSSFGGATAGYSMRGC